MYAKCLADMLNLQPVTRPVPQPKAGEILIQVYATGGTPAEKLWYTPVIMRMARHDPRRSQGTNSQASLQG
jgi:NADPH:quinone reductase-like Zn-dependent oxidoreductase